jgi:hypothetical protein
MAHRADRPFLGVGSHLTSDDGACLMELVSVAAGEPWCDDPACTHPLLSHVARRVNDATSDHRRADLARFIPALTRASSDDPLAFARIAASCTQVAMEDDLSVLLRALHAAAVRRAGSDDRRRHTLYAHGTAFRSVDLAVLAVLGRPEAVADLALRRMLSTSLRAVHGPQLSPAGHGLLEHPSGQARTPARVGR